MIQYSFENTDETIRLLKLVRQVMPRDSWVMMTLFEALKQTGQEEEAVDLLTVLVRSVLAEGQNAQAQSVLFMVSQVKNPRPELQRLTEPLRQLAEAGLGNDSENLSPLRERGDNLAPQVELLWKLYGIGEIERHEYVLLLEQMAGEGGPASDGPLSALKVMDDQGIGDPARSLQVLAAGVGMPPIDLDRFSLSENVLSRLSPVYWRTRGAMPFGELVDQLMVALINPCDERLVEDLQKTAGSRCHFYACEYGAYVRALDRAEAAWNLNASDAPPEPVFGSSGDGV